MNTQRQVGVTPLFVLALALAAVFLLGTLLKAEVIQHEITNPLPPLTDHALNHGWNSVCVWEWCRRLDNPERYRWDCGDGKVKFVFPMEQGEWGFYVATEGLFKTITSFPVYDSAYLRSVLKGCKNEYMGIDDLLGTP